jgi:hypothetical protein
MTRAFLRASALTRLAAVVVTMATLIAAGACGSDRPTEVSLAAGTYTLVKVNGQPLPYTEVNSELTFDLLEQELVLKPDGTYTLALVVRITSGGQSQEFPSADDGFYTVSGTSITLTSSEIGQGSTTGTLVGGTLTLLVDGATFELRR